MGVGYASMDCITDRKTLITTTFRFTLIKCLVKGVCPRGMNPARVQQRLSSSENLYILNFLFEKKQKRLPLLLLIVAFILIDRIRTIIVNDVTQTVTTIVTQKDSD